MTRPSTWARARLAITLAALLLSPAAAVRWVDTDADGVPDWSDYCPNTPPNTRIDVAGCSELQMDADGDHLCNPDRPRYESGSHKNSYVPTYTNWCVKLDNCKYVYNPKQTRTVVNTWKGDACNRSMCVRLCPRDVFVVGGHAGRAVIVVGN